MLQTHPHLELQGLLLLQSAGAMTAGTKSQAERATVRMSLSRASPSSHGHPPTQAMVTWFHHESGSLVTLAQTAQPSAVTHSRPSHRPEDNTCSCRSKKCFFSHSPGKVSQPAALRRTEIQGWLLHSAHQLLLVQIHAPIIRMKPNHFQCSRETFCVSDHIPH